MATTKQELIDETKNLLAKVRDDLEPMERESLNANLWELVEHHGLAKDKAIFDDLFAGLTPLDTFAFGVAAGRHAGDPHP